MKITPYFKDGRWDCHSTLGKVSATAMLRESIANLEFWIIPRLSQNLHLGVDFVRAFNLAPDLFLTKDIPSWQGSRALETVDDICGEQHGLSPMQ